LKFIIKVIENIFSFTTPKRSYEVLSSLCVCQAASVIMIILITMWSINFYILIFFSEIIVPIFDLRLVEMFMR